MHKRKICVVTGTRAEYGLISWLMKEIKNDPALVLQVAVTGMHLSPEFGLTYRKIEEDGFRINEKVEMLLSSDTPVGIAKSIGMGVGGFASAFARLKPDIIVLPADRFEIFAAAQAALVLRIPLAHIYGGETTEGAIDEAMRHSITKMSHIHFTAAEQYRRRVIQLGEDPKHVLNYGAPGLDNLKKLKLLNKSALEKAIDFQLGKTSFLITYHPATLSTATPGKAFGELLKAINHFPEAKIIFTKANADAAGRIINEMLDNYTEKNSHRAVVFTSMGQLLYLSAMKNVDVVIGNSSSGLLEAPTLKKPVVNIGNRQQGRLRAESIIDCEENAQAIIESIGKGLSPEFKKLSENAVNPYGQGNASFKIKEYLKKISLKNILVKKFYDMSNE